MEKNENSELFERCVRAWKTYHETMDLNIGWENASANLMRERQAIGIEPGDEWSKACDESLRRLGKPLE